MACSRRAGFPVAGSILRPLAMKLPITVIDLLLSASAHLGFRRASGRKKCARFECGRLHLGHAKAVKDKRRRGGKGLLRARPSIPSTATPVQDEGQGPPFRKRTGSDKALGLCLHVLHRHGRQWGVRKIGPERLGVFEARVSPGAEELLRRADALRAALK